MITRTLLLSTLLFSLCASANAQTTETVYISDVLFVPLRSGQGNEYRIVNAGLKSGTALTRVEQSEDGAWSKVITQGGTEGWIRNQYIAENKTAQLKLNEALSRLAVLEKQNMGLQESNAELVSKNNSLASATKRASSAQANAEEELKKIKTLSAGAISLEQRYRDLLEKHELTQTRRDSLLAENESLKNDQKMSFMLYGAGLIIFGMLVSVFMSSMKSRNRYSEWK